MSQRYLDCILAERRKSLQTRKKLCCNDFFNQKLRTKMVFMVPFSMQFYDFYKRGFAFLNVKANSKNICEEISIPLFSSEKC